MSSLLAFQYCDYCQGNCPLFHYTVGMRNTKKHTPNQNLLYKECTPLNAALSAYSERNYLNHKVFGTVIESLHSVMDALTKKDQNIIPPSKIIYILSKTSSKSVSRFYTHQLSLDYVLLI